MPRAGTFVKREAGTAAPHSGLPLRPVWNGLFCVIGCGDAPALGSVPGPHHLPVTAGLDIRCAARTPSPAALFHRRTGIIDKETRCRSVGSMKMGRPARWTARQNALIR
jgi:hypothetical protein